MLSFLAVVSLKATGQIAKGFLHLSGDSFGPLKLNGCYTCYTILLGRNSSPGCPAPPGRSRCPAKKNPLLHPADNAPERGL